MAEHILGTGDELALHDDQRMLRRVIWPTRRLGSTLGNTILITVGACYGVHVAAVDGTLVLPASTTPAGVSDCTPRFCIARSGPTPTITLLERLVTAMR